MTEHDLRAALSAALTPEHLDGVLKMATRSVSRNGDPEDCEDQTDLGLACEALVEWLTQEVGATLADENIGEHLSCYPVHDCEVEG